VDVSRISPEFGTTLCGERSILLEWRIERIPVPNMVPSDLKANQFFKITVQV
jgi:hypothetical protein